MAELRWRGSDGWARSGVRRGMSSSMSRMNWARTRSHPSGSRTSRQGGSAKSRLIGFGARLSRAEPNASPMSRSHASGLPIVSMFRPTIWAIVRSFSTMSTRAALPAVGLEPDRARPGEQVDAVRPLIVPPRQVEHALLQPVGDGAGGLHVGGRLELLALVLTGDDPYGDGEAARVIRVNRSRFLQRQAREKRPRRGTPGPFFSTRR